MNFIKILKRLEAYSLSLPYVNSVNLGDIYEYLNGKLNVKYASVNIDINNSVRNDGLISYSVYLYYIDRLTEDKSNWLEVKTTAELVLNSIINYAAQIGDVNDGWTINYFEQQFADYCAGGYVQFNLEVPNEMGECLIDEYEEGEIIYPDFPEHRIIDDDVIAKDKTWSSFKINEIVIDLSTNINNCDGRISELETTVNNLDTSVSDLNNRIETVEGELEDLDEFTCGTIVPTTTNFVEGTSYTIHEALLRTANLFEGYQGEIDDINSLIPNQATEQNQLADKAFVNSTVATNAANFRGNWSNWANVPTNANQYPEDYVGNRTPTNNDYMVVQDAGGFVPSDFTDDPNNIVIQKSSRDTPYGIDITIGGTTTHYTYTNFPNSRWTPLTESGWITIRYSGPTGYQVRTNRTYFVDNVEHIPNSITMVMLNSETVGTKHYISQNLGVLPVALNGSWRFIYVGDWATSGKLGWKSQYQIDSVLTAGQNIEIAANTISAKGYVFDESVGGFATKYVNNDNENNVYVATNTASKSGAFAEGWNTTASGEYGTHAEGYETTASGEISHAEGYSTTASGNYGSHAEGYQSVASGEVSHAEGNSTASSYYSHAEGQKTTASGNSSHSEGAYTTAQNITEHAEGYFNVSHKATSTSQYDGNEGNTQHSVGIMQKNALEIMQNGDMYIYGVGGYKGTDTKVQDATIKTLQEYIASLEARIAALEGA